MKAQAMRPKEGMMNTDELVERLLRKGYRREIWHEPDGTMNVLCDPDDEGAEAFDVNPDGPEAAAALTRYQSLLDEAGKTLAWYAEQAEGCRKLGYIGDPFRHALDADGGKCANDTLQAIREEQSQ